MDLMMFGAHGRRNLEEALYRVGGASVLRRQSRSEHDGSQGTEDCAAM
jgi:hypothetical protein